MRFAFPVPLGLTLFVLLSACSKQSGSTPSGGPALGPATEAAQSSSSAGMTDAQKKAILATLPAAYQNADLDNGQTKVALCKSCHTLAKGAGPGVGPNLWGVFGRKAGSAPGFAYSDGMKALGIAWDADKINTWISKPSAMVPGTKMTYAGMESAKDRIDVVAYLKVATSEPPK